MKEKKRLYAIIGGMVGVVLLGGVVFAVLNKPAPADTTNLESEKKTITLKNGKKLTGVKNGMEIAGTHTPTKDQALFYTVSTAKKQLVSSGTIAPEKGGEFSRNIAFTGDELKSNTPLTLTVYTQSNKGDITDKLTVETVYKQ